MNVIIIILLLLKRVAILTGTRDSLLGMPRSYANTWIRIKVPRPHALIKSRAMHSLANNQHELKAYGVYVSPTYFNREGLY